MYGTQNTTPGADGGFTGYTFYPSNDGVPGPCSTGNFTDVVVNSSRGPTPEKTHHELRHVLLGDFGRVAPYGAHGTGSVNRQTTKQRRKLLLIGSNHDPLTFPLGYVSRGTVRFLSGTFAPLLPLRCYPSIVGCRLFIYGSNQQTCAPHRTSPVHWSRQGLKLDRHSRC